ncbi:hypothetical protein [Burkholderia cenocepacia]|uniref:hypothetical protein n=1 Tax=Burkholderia cenocepacia TaxID=95486 RepID=UPI001B9B711D|nr:hypothetical protein [Burkholderia cenocepacia]MBR7945402.1 hypothetical protein [Burkholderia cenocepacia]
MTATALDQCIGFSNTDDCEVVERDRTQATKPASEFAADPIHVQFIENEVRFRTLSAAPDMRGMKARATAWLRHHDHYKDATEQRLDAAASGLAAFTRSFFAAYQGFRGAPQSAPF